MAIRADYDFDSTTEATHRSLSRPQFQLLTMLIFLTLIGFLVAILAEQVLAAFRNNPGLNGLILGVLVIGVLYAFRQVIRLYPEIKWVNSFRLSDPSMTLDARQPELLAPMANMLRDRSGPFSLSSASMRSILESIGSRLDEARDTSRYLVGLLIFLGLLGTFWGLLETINSVGLTISSLDVGSGDSALIFEDLKTGLEA
ncbi:MAG: flagellar motor protein MotA, partial [Pseudomonadota bacterium]